MESALWMALRTLEERQQLGDKMAKRATEHGLNRAASRFRQTAGEARKAASTLRDLLLNGGSGGLAAETASDVAEGEHVH
ncbi:MAG: hypothetical protein JO247_24370 [Chloroflexi bacterium]|nr:hypothetical protein [Chloroflexota bacterium]